MSKCTLFHCIMSTQRKKFRKISINSGKSYQNTFNKPQIIFLLTVTIHYLLLDKLKMKKCFIFAVFFFSQVFGLFNQCCERAEEHCEAPCAGKSCSAGCRVQCGFFSSPCPAVSCGVANPAQCTGGSGGSTSSCDSGYTLAGSRCYKLVTSSSNYLQV